MSWIKRKVSRIQFLDVNITCCGRTILLSVLSRKFLFDGFFVIGLITLPRKKRPLAPIIGWCWDLDGEG